MNADNIQPILADMAAHGDWGKAKDGYKEALKAMIRASGAKDVLEVGGGRFPMFTQEEVEALGIRYTSNDISERELSLAPEWAGRAHFDIQTPEGVDAFAGKFDFIFSMMVMEHVANFERAYKNIQSLLRPGGIAVAFHPVLYNTPFIINRLMPETLSAKLLKTMFPHRTDTGIPKFPATYSGCRISKAVRARMRSFGFTDVQQIPFYGHNYYRKMPVIRSVHSALTNLVRSAGAKTLATYSLTVAVK